MKYFVPSLLAGYFLLKLISELVPQLWHQTQMLNVGDDSPPYRGESHGNNNRSNQLSRTNPPDTPAMGSFGVGGARLRGAPTPLYQAPN